MLLEDLPDDQKAVVFVRSKAQGIRLREALGKDKAVFINAQNKQNEEEETFDEILEKNQFKQKILIVTKFLDVGVNLIDLKIKHVVLYSYYKEDLVQMLGRKRITQKNEILRMYILVPSYQEITKELEQLEREQQEMSRAEYFFKSRFTGFFNELPKPLFIISDEGKMVYRCNHFSYALNQYHIQALNEFLAGGTDRNFYENFVRIILSWLPGHQEPRTYGPDKTTIKPLQEEVRAILEPLVGTELVREDMVPLCEQLIKTLKLPRRGDQKDSLPSQILKRYFVQFKIPYSFVNLSKKGKKGVWTVRKGYWE